MSKPKPPILLSSLIQMLQIELEKTGDKPVYVLDQYHSVIMTPQSVSIRQIFELNESDLHEVYVIRS